MDDSLVATQLAQDARIKQAKELLLEAIKEHQQKITTIRPPLAQHKKTYQETLQAFAKQRGIKMWYPYLGSGIGHGALVELHDGSVKYDFISGIGAQYFGHSHPTIIEAAIDASIGDIVMEGNLQQNIDTVILTKQLLKASGMDHCFLTTSGSMAVENGLKIAFQYRHPAYRILAFERCFSGRTLATAQISDNALYRQGLPNTLAVDYVPFFDADDPAGSTANAVATLKSLLARYPDQYAAMIFELIQGEGGFYPGDVRFFEAIIEILKAENISVFIDEIQTFARTPELFAFQYFGLEEHVDIVTLGKAAQVCATLFRTAFKPREGLLSQTFTASASAIRASYAMIDNMQRDGFFGPNGKIAEVNHYFIQNLENLHSRHPDLIRGPFGLGAMVAFTPYAGESKDTITLAHALFEAGVIVFIAGRNPCRIRMLPPIGAISLEDIDNVMAIIEKTLIKLKP